MMSGRKRIAIAVIGVLALASLALGVFGLTTGFTPLPRWTGRNNGYFSGMNSPYGMMGGYQGYQINVATLTEEELQADITAAQINAQVDEQANTVTYTGSDVKLVVVGGPEEADEKFVINGLINPTVYLPKGATVTLEFVNADEGMPHAFRITDAFPPYDYMAMMDGAVYPGSLIPTLPVAANGEYPVAESTFTAAETGTFYYICQYPGHAQEGMYGQIVIE